MQLANSKIFNNRNIYRDKSEVKSGIEIVDPIFKDFIPSQLEPKKFWTGLRNIKNPTQSVKKPGVIKSNPEINRKIPPLISSAGIIP